MEAKRLAISFVIDSGMKMLSNQFARYISATLINVEMSLYGVLNY